MCMSIIYLIRHGQASFGNNNYDKLSPLGLRQSRVLAQFFLDTGFQPDAVYSGPLCRHTSTANELLACYAENGRHVPELEILDGFDEYDIKSIIRAAINDDPSLKDELPRIYSSNSSFKKIFETATLRWVAGRFDAHGVQRWEGLKERVANAMKTIVKIHGKSRHIAVFTSGGAISASLAHVLGLPGDRAMRLNWQILNTSITRFVYDDERITLGGFNSVAHLEVARDPSLITYR